MYVAALSMTIAAFVLSGCAAPGTLNPQTLKADEVASAVTVEASKFDSHVKFTGPRVVDYTRRGLLSDRLDWFLRGWKQKSGEATSHQLYVTIWHQDRRSRHYASASFEGGREASTTRIDYRPSCMAGGGIVTCTHDETVGVSLPEALLAEHRQLGLQVRLNARSGHHNIVTIPASYIDGYLRGIGQ